MKQLKMDLQAISKNLKQLTLKAEKIAKKLDELERSKPVRKSPAKANLEAPKKPVQISAAATM